jgi:glycosyltransferase involved in cell wall biosynthesis
VLSLIADFSFGGAATRLLGLAKAIDRSRFDYTLASIKCTDPQIDQVFGSLRKEILAAGFPIVELGEPYSRTRPSSLFPQNVARAGYVFNDLVWRVRRLIRDLHVDVLDCHLLIANLVGATAGRIAGVPTAATLYSASGWTPFLPRLVEQLALGASTAVVTDSLAKRSEIKKWMIRRHPKFCVIPNPIYVPASSEGVEQMRKLLGLPPDPKVRIIGQISRLLPSKGFDTLIAASRLVLEQEPEVAFLLVGHDETGGSYKEHLEQKVKRLNVAERVRILGYPGPIGDVWKVIDLHAHPTEFDSLPSVIIEGMSLGKPAVVSSVGGIPEMVEHGRTALVIRSGDAHALAKKIVYLLRHPERARSLGENANRLYEQRYHPKIVARQFENLFTEMVGPRSRFGLESKASD